MCDLTEQRSRLAGGMDSQPCVPLKLRHDGMTRRLPVCSKQLMLPALVELAATMFHPNIGASSGSVVLAVDGRILRTNAELQCALDQQRRTGRTPTLDVTAAAVWQPAAEARLLVAAQAAAPFTIACASIRSIRGQTASNIATHVAFAERAAKAGAQLVCFPEGSIHSLWCTFDVGATTTELAANSEPIPGPTTALLSSHCKRLNIAMAVGMNHLGMARMPNGKALNAYVVIDGAGVVHVQHKAHPTWCEDKFYRGGGDYWSVFKLNSAPGRLFAAGICAVSLRSVTERPDVVRRCLQCSVERCISCSHNNIDQNVTLLSLILLPFVLGAGSILHRAEFVR